MCGAALPRNHNQATSPRCRQPGALSHAAAENKKRNRQIKGLFYVVEFRRTYLHLRTTYESRAEAIVHVTIIK